MNGIKAPLILMLVISIIVGVSQGTHPLDIFFTAVLFLLVIAFITLGALGIVWCVISIYKESCTEAHEPGDLEGILADLRQVGLILKDEFLHAMRRKG